MNELFKRYELKKQAADGTIRKLHAKSIGENSVHGSDAAETAAIELAPYNIRGNSIHPGLIKTAMTAITPESEATMTAAAAATPARRIGEPDEVANVVLMLATDESRFSTGAEFVIDGGITAH